MEMTPRIRGRMDCDDLEACSRADTSHVTTLRVGFCSGAIGASVVQAFESVDDEDRGGIVLRLRVANQASAFLPFAETIPDGVEIHIAGDAEADAMLTALEAVITVLQRRPRRA